MMSASNVDAAEASDKTNASSPQASAPEDPKDRIEAASSERAETPNRTVTTDRVLMVALITGMLAIAGNGIQAWQAARLEDRRSQASLELEDRRFRSSLVLKALEAKTPEAAVHALEIFVKAGFLEDKGGYIRELATAPGKVPIFSPVDPGGRFSIDVSLDTYCRSIGAVYDRTRAGCWDGKRVVKIDDASVCKSATGAVDYTYDSATATVYCHGQRLERN